MVFEKVITDHQNLLTSRSSNTKRKEKQDISNINVLFTFLVVIVISFGKIQFGIMISGWNKATEPYGDEHSWKDQTLHPDNGFKDRYYTFMQTAIQSVTNLGGMIGALYTGKLRSKGRWNVIMGINSLLITSCLVCLIPNDTVLIIGRFFYGIACGAFTFICPKYIAEFAPLEIRGTLGGLTEVFVTVGAMIPFLLGPLYTPLAD